MASELRLDALVRFMIAVGRKRLALEESGRRARAVALHPETLDEIRELGERVYARNSRSFVEVLGLELEADSALARRQIEVRP